MIINPETTSWCRPDNLVSCPPYHLSNTGEAIHRNDTSRFPYSAYHLYCGPGNADFAEKPVDICDPYSNPQSQEILQLLPHPEWAIHGYPEKQGDGWIGDSRTWELDVGRLSSQLYFYQVIYLWLHLLCISTLVFGCIFLSAWQHEEVSVSDFRFSLLMVLTQKNIRSWVPCVLINILHALLKHSLCVNYLVSYLLLTTWFSFSWISYPDVLCLSFIK